MRVFISKSDVLISESDAWWGISPEEHKRLMGESAAPKAPSEDEQKAFQAELARNQQLEAVERAASKELQDYRAKMGVKDGQITPDAIKFSDKYEALYSAWNKAFQAWRTSNGILTGKFKSQYRIHRATLRLKQRRGES